MLNQITLRNLITVCCALTLLAVCNSAFAQADEVTKKVTAPAANPQVGWIEISGPLNEGPPPFAVGPVRSEFGMLRALTGKLEYVADQPGHAGVVIFLNQPVLTRGQMYELERAMQRVRDAGKKVVVHAETYNLGTYALACAADHIYLQRGGGVELGGMGVEEVYVAGLLDKIGATVDLHQIGAYKGARDPLVRTGPSDQWNQTMDALLDDLFEQVVERISSSREMTRAQVIDLMSQSLAMSDEELVGAGLIDGLSDPGLPDLSNEVFGNFRWDAQLGVVRQQPPSNPFALFQMLLAPPAPRATKPAIAVLYANGPIMSGESNQPSLLGGAASIGSQTMLEELAKANNNPNIKGVLIRLDSPGGSALASEVIWQAVREVRKTKPVYISIGDVAASGGYYIAVAGDRIYASPESIVGSIGVVGGKIVLGELYSKVGLSVHRRSRGPLGDMFNSVEPFTPDQRALLEKSMQRTYDQFVNRVEQGRDEKLKAGIDDVAQGRVFTGRKAAELGMIDEVGDMQAAVEALAVAANLQPGTYDTLPMPAPLSLPEYLEKMFSGPGGSSALSPTSSPLFSGQSVFWQAAERAMGPRAWRPTSSLIVGMSLLQDEPVLAILPAAIVVK